MPKIADFGLISSLKSERGGRDCLHPLGKKAKEALFASPLRAHTHDAHTHDAHPVE